MSYFRPYETNYGIPRHSHSNMGQFGGSMHGRINMARFGVPHGHTNMGQFGGPRLNSRPYMRHCGVSRFSMMSDHGWQHRGNFNNVNSHFCNANSTLSNAPPVRPSLINFTQATETEAPESDLGTAETGELTSKIVETDQTLDSDGCHKAVQKKTQGKHRYNPYPKLDGSNRGHDLLCKWGWKGSGGIGKCEDGIQEPVYVDAVKGRKGLGHELKDQTAANLSAMERTISEETNISVKTNKIQTVHPFADSKIDFAVSPEQLGGSAVPLVKHDCNPSHISAKDSDTSLHTNLQSKITSVSKASLINFSQATEIVTENDKNDLQTEKLPSASQPETSQSVQSLKTVEKEMSGKHRYNPYPKLSTGNIGHRLLCKLGWKGSGGIGKSEDGIVEPIYLKNVLGRKGVGHEPKPKAKLMPKPKPSINITQQKQDLSSLTLYLCGEGQQENPILTLLESFWKSNIPIFTFRSITKAEDKKRSFQLLSQNMVIATGYGSNAKAARKDAAKRAIELFKETKPIIYKPDSEKPLGNREVIPGLALCPGENDGESNFEMINKSCKKCELPVNWLDDNGQSIFGSKWTVLLFIKYKYISSGSSSCRDIALKKCARHGVTALKVNHPLSDRGVDPCSSVEPSKLTKTAGVGSSDQGPQKGVGHEPKPKAKLKSKPKPSINITRQKQDLSSLTLYLCGEGEQENPILTLLESFWQSNIPIFTLKSITKAEDKKQRSFQLLSQKMVITTGYGSNPKTARKDAAKRAIELFKETQPIIYKPDSEKPLGDREVIPGLALCPGVNNDKRSFEIINESCKKCQLPADWLDDNGQSIFGEKWTVVLLINYKYISSGSGISRDVALQKCARRGVIVLKVNHPISDRDVDPCSSVEESKLKTAGVGSSDQGPPLVPGLTLYIGFRGQEKQEPATIINNSCQKCNLSLEFQHYQGCLERDEAGTIIPHTRHAIMMIGGVKVSTGHGNDQRKVRMDAFRKGVDVLLKTQPIIYKKKQLKNTSKQLDSESINAKRKKLDSKPIALEMKKKKNRGDSGSSIGKEGDNEPLSTTTNTDEDCKPSDCEVDKDELIPGLTIRLPYHSEDKIYSDPQNIILDSCSASNCSSNIKKNKKLSTRKVLCYELFINNKLISTGCGNTGTRAQFDAYTKGLNILLERQPSTYNSDVGHTPLDDGIVPDLILYLNSPADTEYEAADAMIYESCLKCNIRHEFIKYDKQINGKGKYLWCFMLVINGKEVAKGSGSTQNKAKHDTAVNAIHVLLQNHQPVVFKSKTNTDRVLLQNKLSVLIKSEMDADPVLLQNTQPVLIKSEIDADPVLLQNTQPVVIKSEPDQW